MPELKLVLYDIMWSAALSADAFSQCPTRLTDHWFDDQEIGSHLTTITKAP